MDWVQLGQGLRALRRQRGWTQADTARKAGVSQSAVSRAERGHAGHLTGRTLGAIAEALGARHHVRLSWQGEGLDRLLDAAHAGLVDQVVTILRANGWAVIPEATFSRYGERGSIDVLAWHAERRAL
ncbi:MAG TPA: helix-turn-helix transcriptional regulator, partial [Candidatus Limnocylindrales bacterium]|nr:helix-turn-helix transcriptional regulator [Candidatus Limnocylindrales bacterium]